MKAYVFLTDGFEPSEAIVPIDCMKRAGYEVVTVSLMKRKEVAGSQGITVMADVLFDEAEPSFGCADLFFLPGGPGTAGYLQHDELKKAVLAHHGKGKWLAAICAAPMIFGKYGLLKGEKATCYPGYEETLDGAAFVKAPAVVSGQFITGAGAGAALYFGFKIVDTLSGKVAVEALKKNMNYLENKD